MNCIHTYAYQNNICLRQYIYILCFFWPFKKFLRIIIFKSQNFPLFKNKDKNLLLNQTLYPRPLHSEPFALQLSSTDCQGLYIESDDFIYQTLRLLTRSVSSVICRRLLSRSADSCWCRESSPYCVLASSSIAEVKLSFISCTMSCT